MAILIGINLNLIPALISTIKELLKRMTMGIYCIQLEKEHYWQSYVGISQEIERRWGNHKSKLRKNCHRNKYLQNVWNKYGDVFEFHILEEVSCYNDLYELEKEYAYAFGYGDLELCFNIGSPGEVSGMIGRNMSEKAKATLRVKNQGEGHPQAKLTELQARFILTVKTTERTCKNRDFTQKELSNIFGISVACVKDIMIRNTWKNIKPLPFNEYENFKKNLLTKL